MTSFAVMSSEPGVNIMAVADVMETKGFKMERQQLPDSIHFSIIPSHAGCEDKLGDAFREAVQQVRVRSSSRDGERIRVRKMCSAKNKLCFLLGLLL